MPDIVLGNGETLIGIDHNAELRDLYFPFVGLENHVGGRFRHRVGVWIDGHLSWLSDGAWKISTASGFETMSGETMAVNEELGVELFFEDVLYNEKNIFFRQITVKNQWNNARHIKIYFSHEFEIYESRRGDTAYYDPHNKIIAHYKGRRVFLINTSTEGKSFDDYTIGIFGIEEKEGSYKDAEDGKLSQNPIEHGKVDSVIGVYLDIDANSQKTIDYWITIAKTIQEVHDLNDYVNERTPSYLIKTAKDYWHAWVNERNFNFYHLDDEVISLFKKSMLILRSHVDNNGSILASGDSTLLQYGRDAYSYMWPRDGALSAVALDKAGDYNVSKRFFEFCNEVITKDGYFMHKYRPDKSLGSSWHGWIYKGTPQLPIQEDETALVLYSLWKHYEFSKDLEFIESIYNSLIKKAGDFMVSYIDETTGLPKPSYDLWEEKFGTSTFTAASVYAALVAAANFSKLLGKTQHDIKYTTHAQKVKDSILNYLWNDERKMFYKMINFENGNTVLDDTLDFSSIYGVFRFRVLDAHDERVVASIKTMENLASKIPAGGMMRHENDPYYRSSKDVSGNPWIITTLWLAQYYIVAAREEKDFEKAKEILLWVVKHALSTGVLPEQVDPHTGKPLSAAPLTWSHSEFVTTVINYLEKLEELEIFVQDEIKAGF
ncbi:MAG: glycoside hydrolase family 15 protein [Candidatus Levybacteria bacterium]|nr:glycoside hydrolase family 15 protein [Candidatus Levybacteria bacterium]